MLQFRCIKNNYWLSISFVIKIVFPQKELNFKICYTVVCTRLRNGMFFSMEYCMRTRKKSLPIFVYNVNNIPGVYIFPKSWKHSPLLNLKAFPKIWHSVTYPRAKYRGFFMYFVLQKMFVPWEKPCVACKSMVAGRGDFFRF